ncbi:MAG: hypothetical protein QOJ25_311 [Solirubrobacteraceae bacterium]|jgi:hypothetical protein|nr:hypothetical protein [Solirubrobacteraceae bacterium]
MFRLGNGTTVFVGHVATSSHEAAESGRWTLLIAVAALVIGIPLLLYMLGVVFSGLGRLASIFKAGGGTPAGPGSPFVNIIRGAVMGADGRVSTSKTVAVTWTYGVASMLLAIVIAKWLGHGHAYGDLVKNGLQGGYALLIGGPIGAAILAKGIVTNQVATGTSRPAADTPQTSQLVTNDQGQTDLGDLQYVLFNAVALIFFFGGYLVSPQLGLPKIPDVLLGLTSTSAVGYVAKKALTTTGTLAITKVLPERGSAGKTVTLWVSGLVDDDGKVPLDSEIGVDLEGVPATVNSCTTSPEGPQVEIAIPIMPAPGVYDVKVTYKTKQKSATKAKALTVS